jgi:quinoprotein glucose dehydrogenase
MRHLFLSPAIIGLSLITLVDAANVTRVSSSSAQDGNTATQALNSGSSSRWSAEGRGQWMQLDLDAPATVASVEVGFQRGNRNYSFEIQVSSDGRKWQSILDTKSSGKGDGVESFKTQPAEGRFIRLVSNGNNENQWINLHTFRIPGIKVSRKILSQAPPPSRTGGGLQVSVWAENPLTASPVGVSVDPQGRVFSTRVRRRKQSSLDIRSFRDWVKHDLSIQSLDDRLSFYQKAMGPERFPNIRHYDPPDRNKDGKRDMQDLTVQTEEIHRIVDTDGDGSGDKQVIIDQDLATPVTGIAAGVLWADGALYSAVEPDIWRYDDTNDDGIPDKRTLLARGFSIHIGQGGHNTSGLAMGMDGRIYWSVADKGINATGADGKKVFLPNRGGVLRCEPDGSNLEVFAYGVRNGQELAFDEFANLFTVDNDGDYPGERERFLYLIEGSQIGWRLNWQWFRMQDFARVSGESPYNVWMAEGLFKTRFEGQAAWIVPPVANYSNGPCGFAYNPGTALNERYRNFFFHAQGKKLSAFKVKPRGASFEMTDEHTVHGGIYNTGIDFGPDGALYIADWMNGPSDRGRIWKLDDPEAAKSVLRVQTREILAAGFPGLDIKKLSGFLKHPDMRVRRGSQFELVRRGAAGRRVLLAAVENKAHQLARLHGIWGLGQLGRKDASVLKPLVVFLEDKDPEVRLHVAGVMGDAGHAPVLEAMLPLLEDESIRVRSLAAIAIGKLGRPEAVDPLFALVRQNDNADAYLRHACIMGLLGSVREKPELILAKAEKGTAAEKLVSILVLRRLHHPGIARFLADKDLYLLAEIARAIHDDFSIPDALPALAETLDRQDLKGEPLLRRVINANFRVGRPADAARLARYAARKDAPEKMRTTALACLALWPQPPVLDAVEGRHRVYPARDPAPAASALSAHADALVKSGSTKVMTVLARAMERLKVRELLPVARVMFDAEGASSGLRVQLLTTLAELNDPNLGELVERSLQSKDGRLRATAQKFGWAAGLSGVELASQALESGTLVEKRGALQSLAATKDHAGVKILSGLFDRMVASEGDPKLALDIQESASRSLDARLATRAKAHMSANSSNYSNTLEGGDAEAGRRVVFGHPAAQCIRCHKVAGLGSEVGPDLSKVGSKLSREQILESLVNPQARLTEGYGLLVARLKNGSSVNGAIVKATESKYEIRTAEGILKMISRKDIVSEALTSQMPPMGAILTRKELRDMLEFLGRLK